MIEIYVVADKNDVCWHLSNNYAECEKRLKEFSEDCPDDMPFRIAKLREVSTTQLPILFPGEANGHSSI